MSLILLYIPNAKNGVILTCLQGVWVFVAKGTNVFYCVFMILFGEREKKKTLKIIIF